MPGEVVSQREEKQITSEVEVKQSHFTAPPRWGERLKIHKFKILAGILGILVFAGAVFGAYKLGQKQIQPTPRPIPTPEAIATPTPDPTANWRIYANTEFSYSIKYPSDWHLYPNKFVGPQNKKNIAAITSFDLEVGQPKVDTEVTIPPGEFMVTIGLESEEKSESQTIEDWLEERGSAFEILSEIEVILTGVRAIRQTTERGTTVYIPKNGEVYFIHGTTNIPGGHEETFNLMLSTFRFLE